MNPRHTILLITYRQETMIRGCLDSILSQSVIPYEIVVADDHSPDNTWPIVQEYAAKYPQLIRAYRNEFNLGLFANFNKLMKQATGDFVNVVAADDFLPPDILEKYNEFIESHRLNCDDSFIIHTNSVVLKPDGKKIFKDNSTNFRPNMFEVSAFHCFWGWDTGMSIGLVKKLGYAREDVGYQADLLWHLEKNALADKHYFLNEVGYIYRANVGVSVATDYKAHLQSKRKVVALICEKFADRITPKMKKYFEFDDTWMVYNAEPSFKTYCNFVCHYLRMGRFPKNNIHRNSFKVLMPIWMKNAVKQIIGRKY